MILLGLGALSIFILLLKVASELVQGKKRKE